MRILTAGLLACLLPVSPAVAFDKLLCVGDQATGFSWNGQQWRPGNTPSVTIGRCSKL